MNMPNIVSVGLFNAQAVFKGKTVSPNRKTTMFEIELPIEEGGITYINERSHAVCKNTVICAKPGQSRHTRLPFKCYYIHMIVGEGMLYQVLTALPDFIEVNDPDKFCKMLVSMQKYADTGVPEDTLMLHSLVLELVHALSKCAVPAGTRYCPKANHHAVIERVLTYIDCNLSAELSLEALAASANFSPIYFHKLFKTSTGETLHEYILNRRVKRAADLLISTDMTLSRIAYECGFSSQSYFSYAFKKKMKVAPREYAKRVYMQYEQ